MNLVHALQFASYAKMYLDDDPVCMYFHRRQRIFEAPDKIVKQVAFIINYARLNIDRDDIAATGIYASKMSIK